MAADCQALLDACFRLDTNVYPAPSDPAADINEWLHGAADSGPGPVYVLQSSKNIADWWAKFEEMQLAFRKAAQTIWADAPLRDPASKAFIKRFFISVTEEEFSRGLLWVKKDEQRDKCLVFRRTIKDLASHAADPAQLEAKKFIDMQGSAVDQEAQQLLEEQLNMAPDQVKTIEYPDIEWGPGIDPAKPGARGLPARLSGRLCQSNGSQCRWRRQKAGPRARRGGGGGQTAPRVRPCARR